MTPATFELVNAKDSRVDLSWTADGDEAVARISWSTLSRPFDRPCSAHTIRASTYGMAVLEDEKPSGKEVRP